MAKAKKNLTHEAEQKEEIGNKDREEEKSFEDLGIDARLIRALSKKDGTITKPTPIQRVAIPLILQGKDVVAQAKTGSGKTFAYLLPLLQKLFSDSGSRKKLAPSSFILVPSGELCQQVCQETTSLIDLCKVQLKAVKVTSNMPVADLEAALAMTPDILISTPASLVKCLSGNYIQPKSITDSLEIVVIDEADLLLSFGYEDDLKVLTDLFPRRCQCLLMSATSSADVDKLKKLFLHNPHILTLADLEGSKDKYILENVQQFWVSCDGPDKLLYMLALLKLELVHKKVLIFTNTIYASFRLKLFLEKFAIKCAVLNAELPQNSRFHILEQFNAGVFDYLVATDDGETKASKLEKETFGNSRQHGKYRKLQLDTEFGAVRGIDFKNVHTVVNYDMPRNVTGYIHRIGRTGRAYNSGSSVSLVLPDEIQVLEEIKSFIGEDEGNTFLAPFPLLTKNVVESLRYRAEDTAKSVTKVAIREARAQDLGNEMLNSEKLKAHFQANPRDLDLLKHDKMLGKRTPALHLHHIPAYLQDPTTIQARKMVKLAADAIGNGNPARGAGRGSNSKRKSRKNHDPLRSFSSQRSSSSSFSQRAGKGKRT